MSLPRGLRAFVREFLYAVEPDRLPPANDYGGDTIRTTLTAIADEAAGFTTFESGGYAVQLASNSHAGANLDIAFGPNPTNESRWQPLTPGYVVRAPEGRRFEKFHLRRRSSVPAGILSEEINVVVDAGTILSSQEPAPRVGQVTPSGSYQELLRLLTLAGAEVDGRGSDEGAIAVSGWTGAAYVRQAVSAAGRLLVNLITGQDGITGGAGAVANNTPRVTLASDDPAVAQLGNIETTANAIETSNAAIQTAVETMDNWNESNRAAVNAIAGQAGVAGGVGDVSALTQRMVAGNAANVNDSTTTVTTSSTQILAANSDRFLALIVNSGSTTCYLNFGGTATTGNFALVGGSAMWVPCSVVVNAICASGSTTVSCLSLEQ